jgi:DNA-directed RNA polymerase subunit beta
MTERRSYSSNKFELELPYLIEVQKNSYKHFLQQGKSRLERKSSGLEKIFNDIFPILDAKGQYSLEYLGYNIGTPKYSIKECRERGLTFSVPLIAKLCLKIYEETVEEGKERRPKEEIINDVFICELPQMTDDGTFLYNGAERVVVSQLHRSPGVSFDEEYHTNGSKIWKSRVIPYRGSWVEYQVDPNEILYVNIDRRKKLPASILIRALSAFSPKDPSNREFWLDSYSQVGTLAGLLPEDSSEDFSAELLSSLGLSNIVNIQQGTNDEILAQFYKSEKVHLTDDNAENYLGRILFVDAIDEETTGEVVAEANTVLEMDVIRRLLDASINDIEIVTSDIDAPESGEDSDEITQLMHNTLAADSTRNAEEALIKIYSLTGRGDAPNYAAAKAHFAKLFFVDKFYNLEEVGRYRLNARMNTKVNLNILNSTPDDMVQIIRYMGQLVAGRGMLDDIDHLGNRRARSVGELLGNQLSTGLSRMARAIRDRLSLRDTEEPTPKDLVNSRTVVSVVNQFFGSSQLSQFMDQTNPLAELTHKRRMSALGPGGLTRERAGFEVRDVHHTHYGRLCPIETPEGPNIGLINSLAAYSIINHFGFLETPYRIVGDVAFKNTAGDVLYIPPANWHFDIFKGFTKEPSLFIKRELNANEMAEVAFSLDAIQKEHFANFCNKVFAAKLQGKDVFIKNGKTLRDFSGTPDYVQVNEEIRPKITTFITFLTADEEDRYCTAPASTILTEDNEFKDDYVLVRRQEEYPFVLKNEIDLMDVSPKQIVSVAAGLIPFLEHDDANRALMGSNMQRQAVPLLKSQAPVVGTGLEKRAALDSGSCVRAKFPGMVTFVDATKVVVRRDNFNEEESFLGLSEHDTYELRKFERSNQETCINQKPIVNVGIHVDAGDVLADGASTEQGELALGKNIRVAFVPWNGYNFEDAIIISEELVKGDVFTSVHIEEYEVEVRDTKRGPEELTRQIPNISEEAVANLDDNGIIRIGAPLGPGDIIVGKVTPKGETELSPEERLLRAIFGEKAGDVRDTSLKAPPGMKGVVVHTRLFTRKDRTSKTSKKADQDTINDLRREFADKIGKLQEVRAAKMLELLQGQTSGDILDKETNIVMKQSGKKLTDKLIASIGWDEVSLKSQLSIDAEVNAEALRILELANDKIDEYEQVLEKEIDKVVRGDELKPGVLKMVKVYIAKKRDCKSVIKWRVVMEIKV